MLHSWHSDRQREGETTKMSHYEEFESRHKYKDESKIVSERTRSIITIAVSVVITTVIIGVLFSILMNQMIKNTHSEINNKFAKSDIGSSINLLIKNATKWISWRAGKTNLSVAGVDGVNGNLAGSKPLPYLGSNGNFFDRFINAIGDAFTKSKEAHQIMSTVSSDVDSSTSVYRLSR